MPGPQHRVLELFAAINQFGKMDSYVLPLVVAYTLYFVPLGIGTCARIGCPDSGLWLFLPVMAHWVGVILVRCQYGPVDLDPLLVISGVLLLAATVTGGMLLYHDTNTLFWWTLGLALAGNAACVTKRTRDINRVLPSRLDN